MMLKLLRETLLIIFLFIALSRVGNTEDEINDIGGGIKLENGCYTLLIMVNGKNGVEQKLVQDCRGGRAI